MTLSEWKSVRSPTPRIVASASIADGSSSSRPSTPVDHPARLAQVGAAAAGELLGDGPQTREKPVVQRPVLVAQPVALLAFAGVLDLGLLGEERHGDAETRRAR